MISDTINLHNGIKEANSLSPKAFWMLKEIAIAVSSLAIGILLAIPITLTFAPEGISMTAYYLASTVVSTITANRFIVHIEEHKHWFKRQVAEIILYKEEVKKPPQPDKGLAVSKKIQTHSIQDQKALLLGLNYSKWEEHRLKNSINDVFFIKRILLKCGFTEKNIFEMTDEKQGTDLYPIASNILRQLDFWIETINSSKEKIGFLHYSGHGSQIIPKGKDEIDEMDEIIIPLDYPDSYIDDNTLFKIIQKLNKDAFAVILEDGSHTGTGFDFPFLILEDGTHVVMNKKFLPDADSLKEKCNEIATVVKISGTDDETSSSCGRIEGVESGATTAAFCCTLKKYDYNLTLGKLLQGMKNYLAGENPEGKTYQQKPQITTTRPLDLNAYFMKRETVLQKMPSPLEIKTINLIFPKNKEELTLRKNGKNEEARDFEK